jgi:glycosyltransferase involved in cell wall biosynthesis
MRVLSVVIPTYNRCDTLQRALLAYLTQSALDSMAEIIVVDDGSSDATSAIVAGLAEDSALPIRYFRQDNKGPAAARNVGIREARSGIILFTDDDIIPGPNLVAEHLSSHRKHPEEWVAILGNVTWAPEVKPTPFMNWYGSDGPLFSYAHFADRAELDYTDFYTCNLSLKVGFLRSNGTFDEDFKIASCEDIELGYRLKKAGMRLYYNAKALAFHCQNISFDEACRRAKRAVLLGDKVFRQKEAGIHYYSWRQMRMRSRLKRHLLPFKSCLMVMRRLLSFALFPLKKVMDWRTPLPWSVYRIMFRVYR